jgi:hypothetical protein
MLQKTSANALLKRTTAGVAELASPLTLQTADQQQLLTESTFAPTGDQHRRSAKLLFDRVIGFWSSFKG